MAIEQSFQQISRPECAAAATTMAAPEPDPMWADTNCTFPNGNTVRSSSSVFNRQDYDDDIKTAASTT